MNTVLMVSGGIILLIVIFLLTDLKVYIKYGDIADGSALTLKLYIVKYIRIFKVCKNIRSEEKSFKGQLKSLIDYLFKSKADPIEYAEREMKKSKDFPAILKKIDISKMYIDYLSLDLRLDFDNAAITAISTGAANAILGMVLSKYENNIRGPVRYKVFPGYTGEGTKLRAEIIMHMKILDIVHLLLKK